MFFALLGTPKFMDSSVHTGTVYVTKPGALAKPEPTVLKNRQRGGKSERERTRVFALQTKEATSKPKELILKGKA